MRRSTSASSSSAASAVPRPVASHCFICGARCLFRLQPAPRRGYDSLRLPDAVPAPQPIPVVHVRCRWNLTRAAGELAWAGRLAALAAGAPVAAASSVSLASMATFASSSASAAAASVGGIVAVLEAAQLASASASSASSSVGSGAAGQALGAAVTLLATSSLRNVLELDSSGVEQEVVTPVSPVSSAGGRPLSPPPVSELAATAVALSAPGRRGRRRRFASLDTASSIESQQQQAVQFGAQSDAAFCAAQHSAVMVPVIVEALHRLGWLAAAEYERIREAQNIHLWLDVHPAEFGMVVAQFVSVLAREYTGPESRDIARVLAAIGATVDGYFADRLQQPLIDHWYDRTPPDEVFASCSWVASVWAAYQVAGVAAAAVSGASTSASSVVTAQEAQPPVVRQSTRVRRPPRRPGEGEASVGSALGGVAAASVARPGAAVLASASARVRAASDSSGPPRMLYHHVSPDGRVASRSVARFAYRDGPVVGTFDLPMFLRYGSAILDAGGDLGPVCTPEMPGVLSPETIFTDAEIRRIRHTSPFDVLSLRDQWRLLRVAVVTPHNADGTTFFAEGQALAGRVRVFVRSNSLSQLHCANGDPTFAQEMIAGEAVQSLIAGVDPHGRDLAVLPDSASRAAGRAIRRDFHSLLRRLYAWLELGPPGPGGHGAVESPSRAADVERLYAHSGRPLATDGSAFASFADALWAARGLAFAGNSCKTLVTEPGHGDQPEHCDSSHFHPGDNPHTATGLLFASHTFRTRTHKVSFWQLFPLPTGPDRTLTPAEREIYRRRLPLLYDHGFYDTRPIAAGGVQLFHHGVIHAGVSNVAPPGRRVPAVAADHGARVVLFDSFAPRVDRPDLELQVYSWHYVGEAFGPHSEEFGQAVRAADSIAGHGASRRMTLAEEDAVIAVQRLWDAARSRPLVGDVLIPSYPLATHPELYPPAPREPGPNGAVLTPPVPCSFVIGLPPVPRVGVDAVVDVPSSVAARFACPCPFLTSLTPLCPIHLDLVLGVAIRPSTISGAGLGVIATRRLPVDWRLPYSGPVLDAGTSEDNAYMFSVPRGQVIDGSRLDSGVGRLINSTRGTGLHPNAVLSISGYVPDGGVVAMARVIRPIDAGQEVVLNYGSSYDARFLAAELLRVSASSPPPGAAGVVTRRHVVSASVDTVRVRVHRSPPPPGSSSP